MYLAIVDFVQSTIETLEKDEKSIPKLTKKHQNNIIDVVVLVFLLLTLSISQTFF